MAPLLVGDPRDLFSASSQEAWRKFKRHLKEMSRLGVEAVTTDLWWGLIETAPGVFDWTYYDKLAKTIIEAGLEWIPILSFHRCGGNIGDTVHVPINNWVWNELKQITLVKDVRDLKFVSEQDNTSDEFISFWMTRHALPLYERVMRAFQAHYAKLADHIAEINVSLGPAGELRYPSYNSHDDGTDYPARGALQCYSQPAYESFFVWALGKYGNVHGLDRAWGTNIAGGQEVRPPSNPAEFYQRGDHWDIQYGRDFFEWYSSSLIDHGRLMLRLALSVFGADDSPLAGIDIGAKVPGVHWRTGKREGDRVVLGDRLAELAAGLLRTGINDWDHDDQGRGYRPLIKLLAELQDNPNTRVVLHFTCLEMPDGEGGPEANSVARTLVTWVGAEADRQGVPVKGENAVWWNLPLHNAWRLMRSHLAVPSQEEHYEGLTILRMGNVAENDVANEEMARTIAFAKSRDALAEMPDNRSTPNLPGPDMGLLATA